MPQTATLSSKPKGRHNYASRERAAQTQKFTEESIYQAKVSNERLAQRLNTSRGRTSRFHSPNARLSAEYDDDHQEHNHYTRNSSYSNSNSNSNSRNNSPSKTGRDRTPSRAATTGVRGGRMPYLQQPLTENNTNNRRKADREMELVKGMSDLLETGLNEEALGAILDLLKRGESPDAIVAVVTTLAQHAR